MSTGDLKNNVKKLQNEIKTIKYTGKLDVEGIRDGAPTAFLPLYHYVFTSYSNKLNRDISNSNNELYGKSDLRFIEAVYKILRDMFSYKPPITREQFFLPGFAERKVIMATEILRHVHSVYSPPSTLSSYKLASKLEKKQLDIQTKVQSQSSNQNSYKMQAKPRKVAGKSGADLSEAIVLPRYVSSSHEWRENRSSVSDTNSLPPTDFHDADHRLPQSSPTSTTADSTNGLTKQFTEHITNTLTMLNSQVGKISSALEKVESQIATKESPRVPQITQPQPPSVSSSLQLETLLSKVVLLENRMLLLENKVDDIQIFCTVMLENKTNNSNGGNSETVTRQYPTSKPADDDRDIARDETERSNRMHPSYVNAFAPVADMGVKTAGEPTASTRGRSDDGGDEMADYDDDDNDVTIEDVVATDAGDGESVQKKMADMKFMKTLVGPNDSITSLTSREQDESSSTLLQNSNTNNANFRTTQAWDHQGSQPADTNFGNDFSPIRGHKDSSLMRFDDNSMIHIPVAGVEEEFEPRRLSSTPNKADLDSSTISRVNRIMQMMKETQIQFNQPS